MSNDKFTDLAPMVHLFRRVFVPELDKEAHSAKQRFLAKRPELRSLIQMPPATLDVLSAVRCFAQIGPSFDVINLDYCSHFCPQVERTIGAILRGGVLRNGGYLFLTVARHSWRNKHGLLGERSLARNSGRVQEQVLAEVRLAGWESEVLSGYPMPYRGRGRKACPMLSFGWVLTKD